MTSQPLLQGEILAQQVREAMAKRPRPTRNVSMPNPHETRCNTRADAFAAGEIDNHRRVEEHFAEISEVLADHHRQTMGWVFNALSTIGTDAEIPPAPTQPDSIRAGLVVSAEDESTIIWEKPVLTPYDRKRAIWRDLEERRADLEAKQELTDLERKRLAVILKQIEKAKADAFRESAKDYTPEEKRRIEVDAWRAGAGRDEYNASRRAVREKPNAGYSDLSDLTDAEKTERKAEQRYISNTRARLTKQGHSESEIEARIQESLTKRRERAQLALPIA